MCNELEITKEMRSVVSMDEVKEFINLARDQQDLHELHANSLECAVASEYLDISTKNRMKDAAEKERYLARKWNALWAVFDHAEFHKIDI